MLDWRTASLVLLSLSCGAETALAEASSPVAFPEGYRNWYVDHSTVVLQVHTPADEVGIEQVYANIVAVKGLETGDFDDGAILVVDRFAYVEDSNKTLSQGDRKVIAVMHRDQRRFRDTGGWGFEAFKDGDPAHRLVTDGGKACFSCHAPHSDNSFLFTRLHR
jgi:Cytochrome P460